MKCAGFHREDADRRIPTTLPISCFEQQILPPAEKKRKKKKNHLFGHPKFHRMTPSCETDFSAAPSLNTHDLSKLLLYIPASWVLYLQREKTSIIFALLVCHVGSVVTVPPPAPRRKRDSLSERDLID